MDRLIVPMPDRFPPDLKLTLSVELRHPFLKSSHVTYSSLSLTDYLWRMPNHLKLLVPITFCTRQFPEITVVVAPTSFEERLTPPEVMASLMLGVGHVVIVRQRSYFSIFMRMDRKPSGNPLGTIHIWHPEQEVNPVLSSNDTLAMTLTPASLNGGDISTTTGQGVAGNSTCTPACSPLTVNAARQISEDDWLTVFMKPIGVFFTHPTSAPVSSFLRVPDKEKRYSTRDGKVKSVLRFYDPALDPANPLTMGDLVTDMLEILHHWAVEDRWREGWGEIKMRGERAVTLQIFRVDAAVGSADGVATA